MKERIRFNIELCFTSVYIKMFNSIFYNKHFHYNMPFLRLIFTKIWLSI